MGKNHTTAEAAAIGRPFGAAQRAGATTRVIIEQFQPNG